MWTLLSLLKEAERFLADRAIPSARLEAEILLAHALSTDRVGLYAHYSRPVDEGELDAFRSFVKRRIRGEPTAYITQSREFFSFLFHVTPAVLIPRPETEEVVQMALDLLPADGEGKCALDLCTGSGCIAITLLKMRAGLRAAAVDRSLEALAVARSNALTHGVEVRIGFIAGNLLQPLRNSASLSRFDLITCNPPYIDPEGSHPVDPEVRSYEPAEALFTPSGDPLFFYRRILEDARYFLEPEGVLIFELGAGTSEEVSRLAVRAGWRILEKRRDLSGWERVIGMTHTR